MKRQLTTRERVLLYGAGVLVAVALVYLYGVAPMLNRLSLLQAQRQSLVATLNSLSEQTAVKQGVKKGSAQVDVNAALPVGPNEPSFLQLLAADAHANKVNLVSVSRMGEAGMGSGSSTTSATTGSATAAEQSAIANSTQAQAALQALAGQLGDTITNTSGPIEVGNPSIPSLDYEVSASGSASDIEAFLADLYHSQRLLDLYVTDVKGTGGGAAVADLQIAAYYQPAN